MLVDALYVHIDHVAECPEVDPILCAVEDIPDHRHLQDIYWLRLDPTLNVGLGRGWQVAAQLPVDLRVVRVDYVDMEGQPYDPPYDDIHHRDETLYGPVDAEARVSRYMRHASTTWGLTAGTTLPIGRTEEDPYALGAEGLEHEHLQFGTGTFLPVARAEVFAGRGRWGALGQLDGAWSLYENGKGYQAPSRASLLGGPTLRVTPTVSAWLLPQVGVETPERWSGVAYGGVFRAMVGLGGAAALSPSWSLTAEARATVFQTSLVADPEGTLVQPVVATLGVSWAPKHRTEPR